MIKIAVCDDQESMSEIISKKIKEQQIGETCQVDIFHTGEDVLKAMEHVRYDLYYLDIELKEGGMNGYKLAELIRERNYSAILIFLSSHDEYACKAYEVEALRFLKKPIEEEKFQEAFKKALKLLLKGRWIFSYTVNYQEKRISVREIRYLESKGRKIILHTNTGGKETFYGSLKEIQKDLEGRFFAMCHSSYLVNLEYVEGISADMICLSSGERLPISRRCKSVVHSKYTEYLFMINQGEI